MENDLNRNEIMLKENITKLQIILNKITADFSEALVDPVNLDEIRKILKVNKI
jgi:hypothetical protein